MKIFSNFPYFNFLLICCFAVLIVCKSSAQEERRPNIILIMTDQQRTDAVGYTGNTAIFTPNLDRLAADGVIFSNAYSSTPSCTPARAALLTGLSPWHHGMLGYGRVARHYGFVKDGKLVIRENSLIYSPHYPKEELNANEALKRWVDELVSSFVLE